MSGRHRSAGRIHVETGHLALQSQRPVVRHRSRNVLASHRLSGISESFLLTAYTQGRNHHTVDCYGIVFHLHVDYILAVVLHILVAESQVTERDNVLVRQIAIYFQRILTVDVCNHTVLGGIVYGNRCSDKRLTVLVGHTALDDRLGIESSGGGTNHHRRKDLLCMLSLKIQLHLLLHH